MLINCSFMGLKSLSGGAIYISETDSDKVG